MAEDAQVADAAAYCTQRAYLYLERRVTTSGPPYSIDELESMAFDPDDVTHLVGLQPTQAWRRGDPHPIRPGARRFSTWGYELGEARTYLTEEVVTGLLDAIEPHAAGIAEACATLGMRAGIMVVIEMRGDRNTDDGGLHVPTAAISYSAPTVQRLARLGLSLDHDQYILSAD